MTPALGWLPPTLRATCWSPLLLAAACLLAAGVLVRAAEASPTAFLSLAAAAVAASAVAGLQDPAAGLLAAVPTSPARRRAHRLLLLIPSVLLTWLGLIALARLISPQWTAGWWLGQTTALIALGVAGTIWGPGRHRLVAGVAAPLVCYAVAEQVRGASGPLAGFVTSWQTHPWMVTGLAAAAIALGRHR